MKKKLISVILSAAMITTTGCSDGKKEEKSPFFSHTTSYRNIYENGMIYVSGSNSNKVVQFLDFNSLNKSVLCAVPNCTHSPSSGECLSKLVGEHPVLIGDSIYFFRVNGSHDIGEIIETPDGPEFFIESKLMKVSLDTSVAETVCEFNDSIPRYLDDIIVIDNLMYFAAFDPDPDIDDTSVAGWANGGGYDFLCSINLDTGEYTNYGSICYVEDQYPAADNSASARLVGYYEDKLWLSYSFLKDEPVFDKETGDFMSPPEFITYTFEFDPETKQYTQSDMPAPLSIIDGYYIYRETDNGASTFMAMKNGVVYNTYLNSDLILNGKCCEQGFEEASSWVTIGEDKVHTIGGEYEGYYIAAFNDEKYVLINDKHNAVKLTEEELLALE